MDDNKAYVIILRDSLVNKKRILNNLVELTEKQYALVRKEDVSADEFDEIISEKGRNIAMLNMIDDGFQNVYDRVKEEIQDDPGKYSDVIQEIQNLIDDTIALGAKIETLEYRNKELIEAFIAKKKTEIKGYATSQNISKNYNVNMANQHVEGASYFMDKKS